jgi:hypothetical protein
MSTNDEKNINEEISRMLKGLQKIKAPANFETKLSRRIDEIDKKIEKENWFDKIFSPKLVPSAALVVTAVIVILVLRNGGTEIEDSFQVQPKLREDKIFMLYKPSIVSNEASDISEKSTRPEEYIASSENELEERTLYRTDTNSSLTRSYRLSSEQRISVTPINYQLDHAIIETGGLNYKVVRLDDEERKQIEFLREKINPSAENPRKN